MPNLHSDKALELQSQDKLNRYPFAKCIAEIIKLQTSKDCIVFGLYGSWGEGKSTVLNFIHHEIISTTKDIVVVKFNPWKFSDEETLLKGFYETLALEITKFNHKLVDKLEKKIKKKELETTIEYLGTKAVQIAAFAKALGYPADWVSITELVKNATIEDLKVRLNKLLEKHNQRLVVIVDDIDRLDENEVHAILKLVKLNADFQQTTYILSFDEKVISRIVGNKFVGDPLAGETFLEKIIQVPIHLPKAYADALTSLAFEKIEELFYNNPSININDEEGRQFADIYTECFQLIAKNPRLIVRYVNTLNFTLPLLFDEVDTVDLMCIEGIKVFFPNYYEFISENPEFVIEPYRKIGLTSDTNPKAEQVKAQLNILGSNLLPNERKAIEQLLFKLFPLLKEAFNNTVIATTQYELWSLNKRVSARDYFGKYFTFSVAKGYVSNVAFNAFIARLDEYIVAKSTLFKFKSLIQDVKVSRAASFFRTKLKNISWQHSVAIVDCFVAISSELDRPFGPGSYFTSDFDQSVLLIDHALRHAPNPSAQQALILDVINKSPNVPFAYDCCRTTCLPWSEEEPAILGEPEATTAFSALKERLLSECGSDPIFIAKPDMALNFLLLWREVLGEESVKTYVNEHLLRSDENALTMVRLVIPWHIHEGDFRNEEYSRLRAICSTATIRRAFVRLYGEEFLSGSPKLFNYNEGQSTENILLQFEHAYKQDPRYPNQD